MAVFIALFATIYIQMAAGKDPALGTTVHDAPRQVSTTSSTSSSDDIDDVLVDDSSDDVGVG